MNNEDFDKFFQPDKLNTANDFAFSEAKWQKMEQLIETSRTDFRWRRLGFWLVLPFILLLSALGGLAWLLNQAQNDLRNVAQEVKMLRSEKPPIKTDPSVFSPKTIAQSDTVYHRIVVKRYDTIYQTVVIKTVLPNLMPSAQQSVFLTEEKGVTDTFISRNTLKTTINLSKSLENAQNTLSSSPIKTTDEAHNLSGKTDTATLNPSILAEKETGEMLVKTPQKEEKKAVIDEKQDTINRHTPLSINTEKQPKIAEIEKKSLEKPLEKGDEKVLEQSNEKPIDKQKTKRLSILKPLKIQGYEIGIASGVAIISGENIVRQKGFSIGGRGGILLGKRLKIVAEAQYLALRYDKDKMTNDVNIPIITPPSPDDVFKKVVVEQPYGHYSVGFQYILFQKQLQPYIGMSVLAQSKLDEKFEYKFENSVTGEDVYVRTVRDEATFQLPFLRLNGGVSYPIFKKFKAQLEGSYDVKLNKIPQFRPIWQVKGAILYRF
jgi:hypothetical protein